jgi:hypothetical protein
MLFRFLILSDEVDDFKREIKIDSEATFLDLHNAILDSVGYYFGRRQLYNGKYAIGRFVGRRTTEASLCIRLYD